jgi:hypothetical protein
MGIKSKYLIIGLKMEILGRFREVMSNMLLTFMDIPEEFLLMTKKRQFGNLVNKLWQKLMITLFQDITHLIV